MPNQNNDIDNSLGTRLERYMIAKYAGLLDELALLRYVHDASDRRTFLSGKVEAYEDMFELIRILINS